MLVHLTCPTCGRAFTRRPSHVRGGHCSMACRYSQRVTLQCVRCGADFNVIAARKDKARYCSRTCLPSAKPVVADDGSVRVPLCTKDGAVVGYTVIDADDAPLVMQWRWTVSHEGYAVRKPAEGGPHVRLHRVLLNLAPGDGMEGDHIDRDRLNNRRSNLRAIPKAGNRQNHPSRGGTSKYRGVYWHAGKWSAYISVRGKSKYLGRFTSEEAAAEAAREARRIHMPYAVD